MKAHFYCFLMICLVSACAQQSILTEPKWNIVLQHDKEGTVSSGSVAALIHVIRQGCKIRVGWGARRKSDPTRTIEHFSDPVWISIRDSETVEVQISDFLINLAVLGEPATEHPRRERFGGTDEAINWRANLKTDGSFNAVWYRAGDGRFVTRVPQQHPMLWVADCVPQLSKPLFPDLD